MPERWELLVSLTFDIKPEDIQVRHRGDAPVDFSHRAFDRVRPRLNALVDKEPFVHFQVEKMPCRCID